ncbi:MAG: thioesterase family protein [Proteobacteria bacterium]|nr:thioesterase family protein [Pseudomonadota bacterium]
MLNSYTMNNTKVKIFDHLDSKLANNQEIKLPLLVSEGKVIEKWIDYNNHMNMAYYVQCFEESSDYILELLNLGHRYAVEEKKGIFVITCKINYIKEITLNENFKIYANKIIIKGKKLILDLSMLNDKQNIVADYNILNLNVDLVNKKSCSFSNHMLNILSD